MLLPPNTPKIKHFFVRLTVCTKSELVSPSVHFVQPFKNSFRKDLEEDWAEQVWSRGVKRRGNLKLLQLKEELQEEKKREKRIHALWWPHAATATRDVVGFHRKVFGYLKSDSNLARS